MCICETEFDEEINLYYLNARYYDATTGRFINVDPIQDGLNWYVYCSNNPLNAKDPTGLAAILARDLGGTDANPNTEDYLHHGVWYVNKGLYVRNFGPYSDKRRTSENPNINSYKILYNRMDDKILEKAANKLFKTSEWDNKNLDKDYNKLLHNCQSYAKAVFNEYKKEWKSEFKNDLLKKDNLDWNKMSLFEKIGMNLKIDKSWSDHYKDITKEKDQIIQKEELTPKRIKGN